MGWWDNGTEPGPIKSDTDRVWWGDEPADIMDSALYQIAASFVKEFGRAPSKAEIVAGIAFSIGPNAAHMDLPDTPTDAKPISGEDRKTVSDLYYNAFADLRDSATTTLDQHIGALNRVREAMRRVTSPYRKNT